LKFDTNFNARTFGSSVVCIKASATSSSLYGMKPWVLGDENVLCAFVIADLCQALQMGLVALPSGDARLRVLNWCKPLLVMTESKALPIIKIRRIRPLAASAAMAINDQTYWRRSWRSTCSARCGTWRRNRVC
jgi:hypothetical protein